MREERVIGKTGKVLFAVALVICILPIWILPYFHTGDGPAHIYSAHVLSHFLFDGNSFYQEYFELNHIPVPNSIVQFLLALLLPFLSFALANKIVITISILCMCFGYRYFLKSVLGSSNFPFAIIILVYCFPMKMGLYSMILGLGAMLFTAGYYIRNRKKFTDAGIVLLSLLILLTWFSHLFCFFGLLLLLFTYETTFLIWKGKSSLPHLSLKVLLCFVPAALFTGLFLREAFYSTPVKFAASDQLFEWIAHLKVMDFCGTDKESYIRWIFYILAIASLFFFIVMKEKRSNTVSVYLLITAATVLLLSIILPENYFSGGFINIRLSYLLLIICCAFIDLIIADGWMRLAKNILLLTAISLASMNAYINQKIFSDDIAVLLQAAKYVDEKSVVLPLNYSSKIMEYNFSLYMACEKDMVILDNAEAATPNSIMRWKKNVWQPELIGNYLVSNRPDINMERYESVTGINIDYLLQWRIDLNTDAKELSHCKLIYKSDHNEVQLWEKNLYKLEPIHALSLFSFGLL